MRRIVKDRPPQKEKLDVLRVWSSEDEATIGPENTSNFFDELNCIRLREMLNDLEAKNSVNTSIFERKACSDRFMNDIKMPPRLLRSFWDHFYTNKHGIRAGSPQDRSPDPRVASNVNHSA